ncbi:MAG: NADH-quinone oxidoreductase subunit E [Bacteroidia bacterium]|nr:MAG: NADH-quinone oxidoreductase subunit E [Bacteroidia bacterium]
MEILKNRMLGPHHLQHLEELKKLYPTSQALVLPVLWMVQEQEGYISKESMRYVADLLSVPYGHVLGVVTFYTMFHQSPVGKHHIEVCTNVSCMLKGAANIVRHLESKLGIRIGETSKDGKWSLAEVECMGACGGAPMCAVGGEYHEHLTTQEIDRLLERLS